MFDLFKTFGRIGLNSNIAVKVTKRIPIVLPNMTRKPLPLHTSNREINQRTTTTIKVVKAAPTLRIPLEFKSLQPMT